MALEVVGLTGLANDANRQPSRIINSNTMRVGWDGTVTGTTGLTSGDIILLIYTGEPGSNVAQAPAANNTHPSSLSTAPTITLAAGGVTSTGWVDCGYARGGNGNRLVGGVWAIKFDSSTHLQVGGQVTYVRTGTSYDTHIRLLVIRGAEDDYANASGVGPILSRSTSNAVPDQQDLEWTRPTGNGWNSTIFSGNFGSVHFGGARRSVGAVDLTAGASEVTNLFTTTTFTGTSDGTGQGGFSLGGGRQHHTTYFDMGRTSFSGFDGTNGANWTYGFPMGGGRDTNGGVTLSLFFREAATATNTPLAVTDEATSLDTFDLVVSRSVDFTDEATGLDTKDSTLARVLDFTDLADALETKDQTKVKNLLLTDEATALDTKADNFGYAVPFTDEASSLDTAQKEVARVFADEATGLEAFDKTLSLLIADSAEAVETSLKNISDSLLESADAVETKDENFGYAEFFTDVTEALDSFGKTQGLGLLEEAEANTDLDLPEKNFVEEASALETFTTTRIYFLPITESAETVDDPDLLKETPADNTVPLTEESSTEETFVVTRVFNLPITESTATVDDLDPDVQKAFTLEITDSASPVETKDETLAWTRGFTDEISTVDLLTKNTETLFTDTADVLDDPVFDFGFSVEFTDEATGLDTAVIPGPAATRNFTESTSAADLLASGVKIGLSLNIICEGILEGKSPPQLLTKEEALAIIDVYNIALNALGVGTLSGVNDGSPQATILNDTFDSFKRQFLTDYSWNGAKKTVALSRLQDYNSTDVNPVGDRWAYAYVLPDDYLRVLRINGYERYNNTQQHLENAFEIEVVNYATSATETANKRCLLTEEPTVNLEYIFEPTDDDLTTLLGSQTEHALGLSFAHYIARNFGKTPQEIAVLADEARRAITAAKGVDGQEKTQRLRPDLGLIESRYWWRG